MQAAILIMAIGAFAVVIQHDVGTRRIPNRATLAIAMLGLLRMIVAHQQVPVVLTFAAATIIFAAAFALYWCNIVGGGDAKLISATALLVGYDDFPRFLILMSLCGAALALLVLYSNRCRRRGPVSRCLTLPVEATVGHLETLPSPSSVPYGAAIAAAGAMMLIQQI